MRRDTKNTGTTAETESKARRAGMTAEQWIYARSQAAQARSRGRGITTRAESKLAGWGEVDGQEGLFGTK